MKVTSINDLKNYSRGTVVELPPFGEGQPFIARMKRPSMLGMVKQGKIPNKLLTTANQLFTKSSGSVIDEDDQDSMGRLFEVLDTICAECFVEPTYEEIKESGIELTDNQMMFLFNYMEHGVNALNSFRKQPRDIVDSDDGQGLQQDAV